MAAESAEAGATQQARLHHVTGLRFAMALWIVCGHYAPDEPPTFFNKVTCRSFMAVDVFVVMSGFVTHWSYGPRLASGALSAKRYLVRRLAHILVATYVAMLLGLAVVLCVPALREEVMPPLYGLLGCFTFLVHWIRPEAWCPSPPTWTIEALIPSWLLYPWTRQLIEKAEKRGGGIALVVILLGVWLASFGPVIGIFVFQGFRLNWAQFATDFLWPPAQLADFVMGAAAAALAQRHLALRRSPDTQARPAATTRRCWGLLADTSFAATAAAVFLMPPPRTHADCQTDWNAMLGHGLAPCIAIFLYVTAVADSSDGVGMGLAASALGHGALVALGEYSFEAYLFQWPLVWVFHIVVGEWPLSAATFVTFVLTLWLIAGLYVEWVAPALTRRARAVGELLLQPRAGTMSRGYFGVASTDDMATPGPAPSGSDSRRGDWL